MRQILLCLDTRAVDETEGNWQIAWSQISKYMCDRALVLCQEQNLNSRTLHFKSFLGLLTLRERIARHLLISWAPEVYKDILSAFQQSGLDLPDFLVKEADSLWTITVYSPHRVKRLYAVAQVNNLKVTMEEEPQ